MPPDPNDQAPETSNLDEVRAWGERRDRAAREALQKAQDAEVRASSYRDAAVKAAAGAAGLSDAQLEQLTALKPEIEPDELVSFAESFGIKAQAPPAEQLPANGQPGQPVPAEAPVGAPAAPVVPQGTGGIPSQPYTTADFIAASTAGDSALLERMAGEVVNGSRGLQLMHPEAQEP